MVMAAEVGGGLVLKQQRMKPMQQALCGPVFGHRPHRVVACHQKVVCLGPSHPLLQPGQLTIGIHRSQGASGLLIHIVVRVAAQHDCVEHDDGQGLTSVGDAKVQLVIVRRKFPKITEHASKVVRLDNIKTSISLDWSSVMRKVLHIF